MMVNCKVLMTYVMGAAWLLVSAQALSLEQPKYRVMHVQDGIEFRQYEPYLITETFVANESGNGDAQKNWKQAGKKGFKRLFRYITGNNISQSDIDMTAPVQLEPGSEDIAMTVPVQSAQQGNGYTVSFVLPKRYTLATAPTPLDPRVRTVRVEGETVAAIRYSGRWTDNNFERYKAKLLSHLNKKGIQTSGEVKSAFYNSPFSLPPFRRNEVLVNITDLNTTYYAEEEMFISRF